MINVIFCFALNNTLHLPLRPDEIFCFLYGSSGFGTEYYALCRCECSVLLQSENRNCQTPTARGRYSSGRMLSVLHLHLLYRHRIYKQFISTCRCFHFRSNCTRRHPCTPLVFAFAPHLATATVRITFFCFFFGLPSAPLLLRIVYFIH